MEAKAGGLSDGVMELWSSPNYFMDVKKGASEDHAILQCNLFLGTRLDPHPHPHLSPSPHPHPQPQPPTLTPTPTLPLPLHLGMGLDAYIAIGRLPGGITQHVWVVTREANGDVRLWETTKGRYYTLPQRWKVRGCLDGPLLGLTLRPSPEPEPNPNPTPGPN